MSTHKTALALLIIVICCTVLGLIISCCCYVLLVAVPETPAPSGADPDVAVSRMEDLSSEELPRYRVWDVAVLEGVAVAVDGDGDRSGDIADERPPSYRE